VDKADPFLNLFKDPAQQTASITDAAKKEKMTVALAYQGAKFKQWVSAHMDASETDMEREADRRHTLAIQGVVEEAVNTIYPIHNVPTYPGTVPARIPAGGHPAEKATPSGASVPSSLAEADTFVQQHKNLAKIPDGLKVTKGFKRNGVTYVLASDGKWYTQ
jgi:hypothetical protein